MILNRNYCNKCNTNFNGSRIYTDKDSMLRSEINRIATMYDIKDIYTGQKLNKNNPSSVEHLIPHIQRNSPYLSKAFDINSLGNLFPVGLKGNRKRDYKEFKDVIIEKPIVLDRMLEEMQKLEAVNTQLINGKEWMKEVRTTLSNVLEGVYCDVKTHKVNFK